MHVEFYTNSLIIEPFDPDFMAPQSSMAAVDKEMPERHPESTAMEAEKKDSVAAQPVIG